jgi:hypothetical protein
MAAKESVTDYMERQPMPQREICSRLRNIILEAIPGIEERMKLGVPYFGEDLYILSLKDHVNLGMSIQCLDVEELKELKGTGRTTRNLEFRSVDDIDEPRIIMLLGKVQGKRGA